MPSVWRPWEEQDGNFAAVTADENQENRPLPIRRRRRSSLSEDFQQAIVDLHKNTSNGFANAVQGVCEPLNLHPSVVRRILARGPQQPKKRGRSSGTLSRADSFHEDVIRRIIYRKYAKNEVQTIRSLLSEVQEKMPEFEYRRNQFHKLLREMGFRYKRIERRCTQSLTSRVVGLRNHYLRKIQEYRNDNRVIVYLDETWFDTHDMKTKGLVDASLNCTMILPSNRGKRIVVLHAGTEDGFLPRCLLLSAENIQSSSADYHADMDSEMFEKWVQTQLRLALEGAYPGKSCIVLLDNASYHSRLRIPNATKSKTKAQLLDIMAARGIQVPQPVPTKAKLLEIINAHNPEQQYYVDEMIKTAGHDVLRLPPYGCELNPIELVWSQYKGNIRAKNTPTLSGTVVDLLRAEEQQPSYKQLWRDCCDHVKKFEVAESRTLPPLSRTFNVGEDSSDEEEFREDDPDVPDDIAVVLE